ncbi:fimbrial protein, partial [Escherichia coli]|uniref:fimbrial protein n=1 Tax=Escherichia coli TaxID=562 RepID=UPI0035CD25B5|nr:hypothetical protein [Escherichia coli]
IGPDPRNFNQRVSLGRNDLLIRTFPNKTVEVQFTGTTEAGGAATDLGLSRTNAIIRMAAQDGTLVTFDGSSKSNATKLMDGSNTLHYQAWVQKGQKAVEEGDFTAVANFNLTYN